MADPLTLAGALGLGAGSAAVNLGGSFLGALFNDSQSAKAVERQIQGAKELMDYEQSNYLSPKAQVKNLGAAGINPAAAFGNTAPVNVGGSFAMPNAQPAMMQVGTQSLSDVAQLLVGAAQAKKAGVEVPNIEEDTQGKVLDNQRKEFENKLLTTYGLRRTAAEVALAEQNVKNAIQTGDNLKIDNSIKEWQSAKEKALSECNEVQRDILKKEFENKDTELQLRNRKSEEEIKTEKSKQTANYASAAASRSSASLNASQVKINEFIAGIKETERNFEQATFDTRFKQELAKLSAIELQNLQTEIHNKDLDAYNAFQRILFGKTQDGDVKNTLQIRIRHHIFRNFII